MKNSADLGGGYPPRPSASVDNTLLDLQNSSYPTQPHSIIAKYLVCLVRPFPPLLEICVTTSTIIYYCNFTLIIWKHVYLKKAGLASRNHCAQYKTLCQPCSRLLIIVSLFNFG